MHLGGSRIIPCWFVGLSYVAFMDEMVNLACENCLVRAKRTNRNGSNNGEGEFLLPAFK